MDMRGAGCDPTHTFLFRSTEEPHSHAEVCKALYPAVCGILTAIFPRERDTTSQLIGSVEEVLTVVCGLVRGDMTWENALARLKVYDGVQAID